MSSHRGVRVLAVLGVVAGLGFTGAIGASASTGRLSAVKPTPVPNAQSWVGGKKLISTKVLTELPAGVPAPPKPAATAWLVADLDTRQILAGQRVHVPLAPASTMKIFTALALAHRLDPKTVYTGRNDDSAVDGTKVGVVAGSTYTVDDLLHGMLMSSGNDCANALGNLSGGKAKAVGLMQDEAIKLGAFDTTPKTTNGLDAPGQASSAYDLALAGSAAIQEPQLEKIMTTRIYNFPGIGKTLSAKRARFQIQTHDKLLTTFPGATGVKNGFTVAARGSYVGTATRGSHSYIAVVLRTEGSTPVQTGKLLDWAFRYGSKAKAVGTLVKPGELASIVGPGTADSQLSAAESPAKGSGSSSAKTALPAAQASLAKSGLSSRTNQLILVVAALGLLAIAFVVGRRPLLNRGRSSQSYRSSSAEYYQPPTRAAARASERGGSRSSRSSSSSRSGARASRSTSSRSYSSDTGSYRADTGAYRADTGAHPADTGPHRADTGAYRADTGPHRADTGPYRADTSSSRADTGPYRADRDSYRSDPGGRGPEANLPTLLGDEGHYQD
jgi:D-alanyl-D-alanine carboxypeptidase (penicillin-binding protein 5/6)